MTNQNTNQNKNQNNINSALNNAINNASIDHRRNDFRRGLTLLELFVGLAVISATVTMIVPNFKTFFMYTEFNNNLRTVTAALNTARHRAVMNNRPIRVHFSDNIIMLQEKRDGRWEGLNSINPGEDITITSNASPIFYPNGSVAPLCSILVDGPKRHYKITISIAGRIKAVKV